jgi:hypothetical protein
MTDRLPPTGPAPIRPGQSINDDRLQSMFWQSGYQLGRYDQRITDLQETRAWLFDSDDEATDAGYHARQRQVDQLQADLLEAENARARHLERLDELIEEWEVHRAAANVDPAADVFEAGDPTTGRDQPSVGRGPNPPRPGGVVRTPRTPDSTHQAYRSQGPTSTFRPRV